jgi:hypothetical protein
VTADPNERFRRVDAIFDEALDLPVDQQSAFVDGACAGDMALREAVHRLLRAHRRSGGFLESPAVHMAAPLLEECAAHAATAVRKLARHRAKDS